MNFHIAFVVELAVAVLLIVSITYSIALERRLRGLRLGEAELRKTIQELTSATERAGRAIDALKTAVEDSETELAAQTRLADRRADELRVQVASGEDLLGRIARIVGQSRVAA